MSPEPAADHPLNRQRLSAAELRDPGGQSPAARALFAWYAPGFSDRLGDRLNLFDNTDGPPLELLRLRAEFSRAADFEFSLRARVAELREFEHAGFARVFRADRLPEPGGGLALVSIRTDGVRLSGVLRLAEQRAARLPAGLVLPLLADAADAAAALHAQGARMVHGAICTDRLVVAPGGRLLVTEYVLGSALRSLPYSRAEFWRQLRIALPGDPAIPAFDQRTDVLQLGLVALSLALSRPLDLDEDLTRLPDLLEEAQSRVPGAGWDGRWPDLREWLERALLLRPGTFPDARRAAEALAGIVPPGPRQPRARGGGAAWDQFVSECEAPPILTAEGVAVRAALGPGDREPETAARNAGEELGLDRWERASAPPPATTPATTPAAGDGEDGPGAEAEHRDWTRPLVPPPRRRIRPGLVLAAVLALATLGGGMYIGARFFAPGREVPRTGTVQVASNPAGARVNVNGTGAGTTPVTLTLPPGTHVIELVAGRRRRAIPVTVTAGGRLSQFVEMPPEVSATGQIQVTTQPEGLAVSVDGEARGPSPLLVTNLSPGPHLVTIQGRGREARQSVEVEAGATAALFVPLGRSGAPAPGWLSVSGGVELQVYENGELLGTSRTARIMLPAGRHRLDLVNQELGVRTSEEVRIPVGGTATLEVELPRGRIDINALPWAEVWLDGERIGDTPLGGVQAVVGRHVVTFRHPELGERRVECVVSAGSPTRVGVDLRR